MTDSLSTVSLGGYVYRPFGRALLEAPDDGSGAPAGSTGAPAPVALPAAPTRILSPEDVRAKVLARREAAAAAPDDVTEPDGEVKPEDEGAEKKEGDEKPEGEKVETDAEGKPWHKVKADLDSANRQIASFNEREEKWSEVVGEAIKRRTEAEVERDHYKALSDQLIDAIKADGKDVDARFLETVELEKKLAMYESEKKRADEEGKLRTDLGRKEAIRAAADPLVSRAMEVIDRYPELSPTKNPRAARFVEALIKDAMASNMPIDEFTGDLVAWVKGQRAKNPAAATTANGAPAARAAAPRTLVGTGTGARPAAPQKFTKILDADSVRERVMARRQARAS